MKYLILISFSLLFFNSLKAQYGDAYHAPDNYALQRAADKRASDQLDAHYKNIAPSSGKSTTNTKSITPASPSYWGDGGAYQRRQAAYEKKVQDREDAYKARMNRFLSLSASVIKNEDNYERLNQLAVDAGFDYYTATRINGLYAPKYDAASIQKRAVRDFNILVEAAEADLAKNYISLAIYKFGAALQYKEEPFVRKKYGDLLFFDADYTKAFEAYKSIEETAITPRPPKDENDYNTGKAALMAEDNKNAFLYLGQSWAANKNYLNGINLSYAYFLENKYDEADGIIKEETVAAQSFTDASLIEHFYLLKKGDGTTVNKFIETIYKDFSDVKISGNTSKDFALILHAQAKKNVTRDRFVNTISLYLVDLAVLLDAENLDFIETRFAFNTARKRKKQAAADEAILNK